jgi:GT2 family glycosyltransferase
MDTGLIAKNGLKSADVCRNAALSAGGKIAGRKNISNLSETLTIALDDSADTAIAAGKIFSAECTNASGETVKVADCLKTRSCVADIVVESKIHLELPVRDPHNPSGVRDIFAAIDLHCPQPVASAIREKLGDLTLISCANNTPEILIVMLKSFKAHHGEGPHRLILFENSAGEDTANLLNNNRVPHIRNAGGTYAGTVDEAIKSCPTKHALVVDPAIVFNQSVIPLYEAFIKNDGIIMGDTCGVPARMQSLFMFIDVEKVNRAGISFLGSGASFYSEIRNAGLNVIQCKADPDFFTSYTDSSSGSKIGEINCETAKYGAVEIKDSFIPGFSGGIGSLKNIVEIPRMEHAISAVVPVLCWTPAAVRAIESLAGQMGEKDEVIVVAEDDPGAGITAGSIPAKTGVKILTAVKNARLASMYNAGIKASSGGVIILSREDIICGKGFFEDHRRGHKEHPGVGAAIIGNIYATKQSHGDTINPYLNGGGIEQVDFGALGGTMCNAGPGFFNTSCVSVKKEFLLDNGAFDEVFGDIITPARELGRRLFENGMELVHVPDISVAWEHPLKFMEYARIRYLEGRAYPYFLDKLLRKRDGKDFAGPLPDDGITWDELMAEKNLKWANVIKSGNTADIKKYVFAICRESFFRGARDAAAENSMGEMLLFENGKWGAYKTGKSGAYVSLLSEYDPEREARLIASRIPADKNVVFIGAGMGRHINEYLSGGTSRRAALYEPHDTLFDYLTTKMDMERITRIKERGELDALKNKGYEAVILPSLRNTECEYSEAYKSFLPDGAAIPG